MSFTPKTYAPFWKFPLKHCGVVAVSNARLAGRSSPYARLAGRSQRAEGGWPGTRSELRAAGRALATA
ncbi:hypothetical protein MSAS_12160 [Mycobacterium saskatchewanense]|nr:hypothetical protein MSAS_12160 [Mycobacterium saskatchewanense]